MHLLPVLLSSPAVFPDNDEQVKAITCVFLKMMESVSFLLLLKHVLNVVAYLLSACLWKIVWKIKIDAESGEEEGENKTEMKVL